MKAFGSKVLMVMVSAAFFAVNANAAIQIHKVDDPSLAAFQTQGVLNVELINTDTADASANPLRAVLEVNKKVINEVSVARPAPGTISTIQIPFSGLDAEFVTFSGFKGFVTVYDGDVVQERRVFVFFTTNPYQIEAKVEIVQVNVADNSVEFNVTLTNKSGVQIPYAGRIAAKTKAPSLASVEFDFYGQGEVTVPVTLYYRPNRESPVFPRQLDVSFFVTIHDRAMLTTDPVPVQVKQ